MAIADLEPEDVTSPAMIETLVANHREFLAFVQRRVGDRAMAEEILQEAFVKSLDKLDTVEENVVGWFYRVLRNAIIDQQRRHAAARRRLEALAAEQDVASADHDAELHDTICRCITRLAATLKPEYASAIERIDVAGVAVKQYAEEAGITASNAGVRVFRAREALRKQLARSCGTCAEHGCLDCTCGSSSHPHET